MISGIPPTAVADDGLSHCHCLQNGQGKSLSVGREDAEVHRGNKAGDIAAMAVKMNLSLIPSSSSLLNYFFVVKAVQIDEGVCRLR